MNMNNSSRNNNGSMNGNGARAIAALQAPDQKFLMDAMMGNNAEIAMGQLALQRASSPDVKNFAQMMVDQHTAANNELMTMAQGATMTMTPGMIDPMHRALADAMSRLSGADFDMAYIKSQMADHALARDLYERYSKNGDNKDLKNYAKKTRPAIEQHYSTVQSMDTRMSPTAMITPTTGP